jgi:uncharacterized cupin superfamily protein
MSTWFAANVADLPWVAAEGRGSACIFENPDDEFEQIGYTLAVLQPGESGGCYHRELDNQEDFLVLAGECLAIVENVERRLRQWDFLHCPPGTEHVLVGAGDGPCVLFCCGARNSRRIVYPRNELALRHGAGAQQETTESREAYAGLPPWGPAPAQPLPSA